MRVLSNADPRSREAARSIEDAFRLVGERIIQELPGDPRKGDVRDSQATIEKAKTLLGYEPIVPFEEGLKRTIEWYRTTVGVA